MDFQQTITFKIHDIIIPGIQFPIRAVGQNITQKLHVQRQLMEKVKKKKEANSCLASQERRKGIRTIMP